MGAANDGGVLSGVREIVTYSPGAGNESDNPQLTRCRSPCRETAQARACCWSFAHTVIPAISFRRVIDWGW